MTRIGQISRSQIVYRCIKDYLCSQPHSNYSIRAIWESLYTFLLLCSCSIIIICRWNVRLESSMVTVVTQLPWRCPWQPMLHLVTSSGSRIGAVRTAALKDSTENYKHHSLSHQQLCTYFVKVGFGSVESNISKSGKYIKCKTSSSCCLLHLKRVQKLKIDCNTLSSY